ncbi:two component, sigma54 specific, transcriptional regulator, Fis family protein [Enhygromyxa salina]|uniref:Two component, sigma54 specific, transcriptional regulator, Fis family protein n=1 Tax=Enhygromyxa salina TaxID=215803 RepID=A0A0C2D4F5_9BACT|nr:two component, sigma54 specific, transcriptional regulator, Fis family protein [Enhygromyxa salina]
MLVVDDRPNMLRLVQKILRSDAQVLTADDGGAAIELLEREAVAVVLSDLKMGEVDGLAVLEACKRIQPGAVFVLMTAYATVGTAIQAMRMGAYDYLSKPFEPEDLRAVILRALGRARQAQAADGQAAAPDTQTILPGVYGRSPAMLALATMVQRIAPTDATALILGETGTGKERVARALHALSPRSSRRFVAVNCAAIPGDLLESELFGHARGAFSGATRDRPGLFEDAEGGSVFLDEIGDMPASLQAKLTRAFQERSVRRVGETHERKIDVRLIAATHRDIEGMVASGTFREDLWYRLNVAPLRLPPLRERSGDVELLARVFLTKQADKRASLATAFSPAALDLLRASAWPGNVRQLEAAIERAAILATGPVIDVDDLPPELRVHAAFNPDLGEDGELVALTWQQAADRARDHMAPNYLRAVLSAAQGNVTAAAARAGIERESFYRLLRKYGVRADNFRD